MPIYADQLIRGRGKFRVRAVIEGWPYIFVDDRSLARTRPDGREQVVGLIPTSLRFAARADLARAELRAQEMTLEIRDTRRGDITRALHTTPASTTWLTADVSATDTAIPVSDTSAFDDSGEIHIGTEAIAYTGKTATSFTGCTRGHWQSVAQAHTLGDGESLWYPRVTDTPRSLVGRRVLFYLYGSGDPASSEGTLRWRGITRGGVEYSEGVYTLAVDPVTRILEQQLGSDLSDEVGIRGIYFPAKAGLRAEFDVHANASPDSPIVGTYILKLAGYFASNAELVDRINHELSTWLVLPAGASLLCVENDEGYEFRYTMPSPAQHLSISGGEIKPREPFAGETWPYGISPGDQFVASSGRRGSWSGVPGGAEYRMAIRAPSPRNVVRHYGSYFAVSDDTATYPMGRFYLAGSLVPSVGSRAVIRASDEEEASGLGELVGGASPIDRYADTFGPIEAGGWWPLGPRARVKIFRDLASGHAGNLIDRLIADSPSLAAGGAMPLLTPGDFNQDWTEVEEAIAGLPLGQHRSFVVSDGVSLGELLAEELKLIGCYLALDGAGRMTIRRLRLATSTDTATATLGSRQIKGRFPGVSDSAEGILGSVMVKHGYNVQEGEHEGRPVLARNTTSPTPLAGTLTIAPLSRRTDVPAGSPEVTAEDAYQIAGPVLGLYGESYEVITPELGLESSELAHGDTALLTTPHIPGARGTMGVAQQPAQVLGFDWSPFEGRGTVDLLLHHRRVAGYSPGFPIVDQARKEDAWVIDLEVTGYAPAGTSARDWLGVGDRVRITEDDSRTPERLTGTVVGVGVSDVAVEVDPTIELAIARTLDPGNLLPAPGAVVWAPINGAPLTSGQADPAGGTDAWRIEDTSGAAWQQGRIPSIPYTPGNALWLSLFVEKDPSAPAGPAGEMEARIGYAGGNTARVRLHPATGEARGFVTAWDEVRAIDLGGWWLLAAKHVGDAVATSYYLDVFPAPEGSGNTGSVTVYGPRIADATADPVGADITRWWDPGSKEWRIGYRSAPDVSTSPAQGRRWTQKDFAFVADERRRIGFADGDVDAVEFSP